MKKNLDKINFAVYCAVFTQSRRPIYQNSPNLARLRSAFEK